MAITFLSAVNSVLRRVGEIAGDSEELATSTVTTTATGATATEAFVDSRRQHKIDIILQLFNEVGYEVRRYGRFSQMVASATLTLSDGVREYDVPNDFDKMAGADSARAMRGVTSGLLLWEYPGGYEQMLVDQVTASDYQGQPNYYAISPVASKIRIDRDPTSAEAGHTYNYLYHKRLSLTSTMATTSLPYPDAVSDNMVPIVVEAYKAIVKKEYTPGFVESAVSRTLELLTQTERRNSYGPVRRCR